MSIALLSYLSGLFTHSKTGGKPSKTGLLLQVLCASGLISVVNAAPVSAAAHYREDSGTSMAAPHVSGAIAAFLSVRREFIGRPDRIKEVFVSTATDLKRDRYFQGSGLVDLMRAIQSV